MGFFSFLQRRKTGGGMLNSNRRWTFWFITHVKCVISPPHLLPLNCRCLSLAPSDATLRRWFRPDLEVMVLLWRSSDGCFFKSLIQVLTELLTLLAICQGIDHAVTLLCCPGMDSLGQSYKSSLHPSESRSESFFWGSNTKHSLLSLVSDAQSRGQSWFPGTNAHHAQVIHLTIKILLVFRNPLPAAERAVSQRACPHCFEVIHLPVPVPFSL